MKTDPETEPDDAHTRLVDLLHDRGARLLWHVHGPTMHSSSLRRTARSAIEAWLVASAADAPPRMIIVHIFPGTDGVGIYSDDGVPHDWTSITAWLASAPAKAAS